MKIRTAHYRLAPTMSVSDGYVSDKFWSLTRKHNISEKDSVLSRGGVTHVQLLDDNGELLREAISVCSIKDNFCRKLGRKIALGRVNSVVMPSDFKLPRGYEAVEIPEELKKFI